MTKIWNTAVTEVGTMQNTESNFVTIAQRFIELAEHKFSKDAIMHVINQNLTATREYMGGC